MSRSSFPTPHRADPVLTPLQIPDAVPIPWDDDSSSLYGVGKAAINSDLAVLIESYDGMAVGDHLSVHWDDSGVPFASHLVEAADIGQHLVLKLDEALFAEGDFQPFYRLERPSLLDVDSPARAIRVQLSTPGGEDPVPDTEHNENLAAPQVPEDLLLNGIDAEQAAQGVDITLAVYPNMAEYDRIDFNWGGQRLIHTVQPQEVGSPLVLHIEQATILAAGDGTIALAYQVIDAAANRSDGWSVTASVEVLASGTVLDAPLVPEAPNGELDLAGLAGADVRVQVVVSGENFAIGESVELTWAGKTDAGLSVDWSDTLPVASLPQVLEFFVPNDSVAAIAQGSAVVSYSLHKLDGSDLPSKRAQIHVVGEIQTLPAPSVREASNGSLAANVEQATVDIAAYTGMAAGDLVTLFWSGEKANGQPTDYRSEHTVSGGTVGQTVTFAVPGAAQVAPLDGGKVTVWYQVSPAGVMQRALAQESERLELSVGSAAGTLPAPTVVEADNGALAPDAPQATVEIDPYTGMAEGDRVDLFWRGNVSGEFTDWLPVSSATVGHALNFTLYPENIATNNSAEVSYSVSRAAGGIEYSAVLQLRIGDPLPLPAPTIDQAVDDTLNPADVPNGATVRIAASANLQAGDLLTVHWIGTPDDGSTDIEHQVTGSEAGNDITVTVPLSVVEANKGNSIELSYDVARAAGGIETSPVAVYDVTEQIGSGRLKVMGARSSLDAMSCYGDGGRRLVALDRDTLEPIEATWQYEGDTSSVTGSSFQDSDRSRLLHVSTDDDHVILNLANLCGPRLALVARRDEGNMVAWGNSANGGSIPPTIATMTDVVELTATGEAMAARRANGTAVAWGQSAQGGTVPGEVNATLDIVQVVGNRPTTTSGTEPLPRAFAALRTTRQAVAWGDSSVGGNVPSEIASLNDIGRLIGGGKAMVALRENGQVVAWGNQTAGGAIPQDIASLNDIVAVAGSFTAFAARRANGTVVAWGDSANGGTVPSPINSLTDIADVTPNSYAFAARRQNGTVVAWGSKNNGGTVPDEISSLNDFVEVVATDGAFAARRANNTVVAWGSGEEATVPSAIASMTDIIAISANLYAFAALRSNGQVVAWGDTKNGGDTSGVVAALTNVRAVYAGGSAFAALCEDKRVVTWGNSASGGNSDGVATVLNGHVSYEATAVSRGIGRHRK